jgi:hypothetical protein
VLEDKYTIESPHPHIWYESHLTRDDCVWARRGFWSLAVVW